MGDAFNFDKPAFEEWFTKNAESIYLLTGIAHYNAANIGLLKMIFMLEQRISTLEQKRTRKKPVNG